ncbi:hypothetical protein LSH36_244g01013 [Paralvinella palmiformis]|uniref:SOCS box domain-containing protein n=1 Tax=Paralvinella palmiformis TaxID=53620 RepID=A0AAD9JLM0_9ANNE|nr:hypothetical protein LSH36_244g01013 [Paralvinella palmiformis]
MEYLEQELGNLHLEGASGLVPSDSKTGSLWDNDNTAQVPKLFDIEQAVKQGDQSMLEELVASAEPSQQSFWLFRRAPLGIELCEKALKAHPSFVTLRDDNLQTLLHQAAKSCDLDICQLLVGRGVELDARDIGENTPLLVAVSENGKSHDRLPFALDMIKYLTAAGASVNAINVTHFTPFLEAVLNNNIVMMQLLVDLGANLWHTNQCDSTALMLSCYSKDEKCFEYIMNLDDCTQDFINKRNEYGVTALHVAVCSRSLMKTRMLLENGADVDMNGYLEWVDVVDAVFPMVIDYKLASINSVLWYAYQVESIDILQCLAKFGCNVNGMTRDGIAMLHQCAIDGNLDWARSLLSLGANPNLLTKSSPLTTPLSLATSEGHLDMVNLLLNSGSNVNMPIEGRSAIFSAFNSPKIMRLLIEHGADVTGSDVQGISALACAVKCGCYEAAKILLLYGADVNICLPSTRMWMGEPSLLFVEVKRCHPDPSMLKLLLEYGADVNSINAKGQTALMCLVRQKNVCHELVSTLLQFRADISRRDDSGKNVFFINVHTHEALPIAVLLLDAGACVNCMDNKGNTPLVFAVGNHSICDVFALLKVNCDLKLQKAFRQAVLSEQYNTSIMLYLAGCDINEVNLWIKENGTAKYRVPVTNHKLMEFVKDITSHPPVLKLLCRQAVRVHIASKGCSTSLSQLPVPKVIQQYLDLADLEPFLS